MASRDDRTRPRRPDRRLYLVSPQVADAAAFARTLADALAGAGVAAVLVRLTASDERGLINLGKSLAPLIQDTGAAFLLADHPDVVARMGADGAHLTGIDAFKAAQAALQPERIAGCGGLTTRHDAMLAGEAGADYVLFGEPDPSGHRPSFEAVAERVAWWAEIFELPCVGFAATLAEVGALAQAGADFVAVGDCIFDDSRGPAAALADAAQRLASLQGVE
ncbi:MAG TPA: thiamine phosphate synthase [Xanthobacteraceae bacterium]|jgi:thiamine-phosphate pyrophosphorylase|nr:thiamine phosphate synthase [Xanthobacteraceae bacterium]